MARKVHHRERKAASLARRDGKRARYVRVLIVCEGEKTEPLYFDDIRIQNRVPKADIRVLSSEFGTQPRQVVDFAELKFKETRAYDHIFAVFDRDDHTTYFDALKQAERLDGKLRNDERKPVPFTAIASVPCFELWLLLHFVDIFEYSERGHILGRTKQHIIGYEKGARNVYSITEPALSEAIRRAAKLKERFNPFAGDKPFTNVDLVVTLLRSIRTNS